VVTDTDERFDVVDHSTSDHPSRSIKGESVTALHVDQIAERNPWTKLDIDDAKDRFSFVLLSDRTGGAQPGVFQRGLAVTDLLAPSFAIQVGDLIEGYLTDPTELNEQWTEIDSMLAQLHTPLFHVPGNHDVSNNLQREVWLARYGRLYYHFRYEDVLFVVIDTQDPPANFDTELTDQLDGYAQQMRLDPAAFRQTLEHAIDWNGRQSALVSEAQLSYIEQVFADNSDVRWTFLCMHMPLWQGDHPAWERMSSALGNRHYTAFAGHVHNYRAEGDDHTQRVRLGSTGGTWVLSGPEGNFQHVTQVTMTARGPLIANIILEGVRDFEGKPVRATATTYAGLM
jgi:serine/threonine-protein phosphatase CPPED1